MRWWGGIRIKNLVVLTKYVSKWKVSRETLMIETVENFSYRKLLCMNTL